MVVRGDRGARASGPCLFPADRAHGLSKREQDVTRLVLRGDSTAQIADGLCVSPHTVQQHLKSVFAKTGSAAGGREPVGKVFSPTTSRATTSGA